MLTHTHTHTHTEGRDGEAGTEIATILRLDTPTTHHMTTAGERRGEGEGGEGEGEGGEVGAEAEEGEVGAEEEGEVGAEEEGGEVEAGIRRNLMKEGTRVTRAEEEEGVVAAGMGRGGDEVGGGGGGDVEGSHKEDRTEVSVRVCVCEMSVYVNPSSSTGGAYPFQQQPQMQYFNGPLSAGAPGGMFFPQYTSPVYYNAPIVPVDKGTLHDYIRKQM